MGLKKTLASLVLAGAAAVGVCGCGTEGNREIYVRYNSDVQGDYVPKDLKDLDQWNEYQLRKQREDWFKVFPQDRSSNPRKW